MNRKLDFKLILHKKENTGIQKYSPNTQPIKIASDLDGESKGVFWSIKEVLKVNLNTQFTPCNEIEDAHQYLLCSIKSIATQMLPLINCTIPGIMDLFENTSLKECEDESSAANTLNHLLSRQYEFFDNPAKHGCLKPCAETYYEVDQNYVHKNSWIEPFKVESSEDKYLLFIIAYQTLQVQEIVTTFQNDLASLLSVGGGNLGLLLGFSCLSVLLNLINAMKQIWK